MVEFTTLLGILAAVLMAMAHALTYRHKAKRSVCPRWLGVPTRRCYKAKYGYDPSLPDNWQPQPRTAGRRYRGLY